MSKKRLELAKLTADDLADPFAQVPMPTDNPVPFDEVAPPAAVARDLPPGELTEAIRALLIMTGCTAKFCGTFWQVRRVGVDNDIPPPGWKGTHHGQKWRFQTGVPANADFETWRKELHAFVGGLGNP